MLLHNYNNDATVSGIKINGYIFKARLWSYGNIVVRSLNKTITINGLKQYDIFLYINSFIYYKKET